MNWYKRNLRPNKSTASPQSVVFFDTETKPLPIPDYSFGEVHTFRLGCATAGHIRKGSLIARKEYDFDSLDGFWKWLQNISAPKHPTWVFAHNLGFDLTIVGIWERIISGELLLIDPLYRPSAKALATGCERPPEPLLILDDPPTVVRVYNQQGSQYLFVDTMNYWRTSLRSIGEMVGQAKLTMPEFDAPNADWFRYCRADVDVLEKAVLELVAWIKREDYGKFRFTVGSQAMGTFRHRFMPNKITFHNDKAVRELERKGYYGGRLDNWYVGERHERMYQFDVASLYPSVMRNAVYPVDLLDSSLRGAIGDPLKRYRPIQLAAECLIDTRRAEFPLRDDGRLIYPVGEFWTYLSGPDLQYAIDCDALVEIGDWAAYKTADLFSEYVNHFWEKRLEYRANGNKVYDGFCKLLLNSLYGKFSQRGIKWRDFPAIEASMPFGSWEHKLAWADSWVTLRSVAGRTQIKESLDDYPTAFPAIAAWVTAYARQRMRFIREIAGYGNYYYQATDSLYTNQDGYDRLIAADIVRENELGYLKLEGQADYAEFRSLNNYTFGDKNVRGTIKPKAVPKGERTWEENRFQHLASVIAGKALNTITVTRVTKHLAERYTKGTIQPDGWVKPFVKTLN